MPEPPRTPSQEHIPRLLNWCRARAGSMCTGCVPLRRRSSGASDSLRRVWCSHKLERPLQQLGVLGAVLVLGFPAGAAVVLLADPGTTTTTSTQVPTEASAPHVHDAGLAAATD